MKQSLIRCEELFRKAFVTSPDSININRLSDGLYVSVNDGFTNISGYTEEETKDKTSNDLNIWADLRDRDKLVKMLKTEGKVVNMESRFKMKDGTLRDGMMSATIIDLDGIPHILSITRDVTEKNRIEQELKENEYRYREALLKSKEQYDDLVSKIPVGIYILRSFKDGEFVLDYVSPRMAEMLDTRVEELLSDASTIYENIYEEDKESFVRLNLDGISFCKPFNWSGRTKHRGGIKWLQISSTPESQKNGEILWHGIVVDITVQKLAEKSLIESERLLRESQNIARMGSFVWDISTGIWESSKILDEIFGIDEKFVRTLDGWVSIIHPDIRAIMADYVTNDIIGKHLKFDKEYRILRKSDGELRWVHGLGGLEFDKNNQPIILIGTIIDITERKKVEEEINKLNTRLEERVNERTAQLEEANNELQAFAYSVSHDLRAPLRAIDGFSKFVLEDYGPMLDTEGQRLLGLIRTNTQKMDNLITDILSLSRVTRGEQKKSKIDMTKMARSMVSEAALPEDQKNLKFIIDELPEIYADPAYLKQVWINLISNAIKFSSLKDKPEIKIGGKVEEGYNVYFVKDNGVGFNQDYSHKLFSVFQRLHKTNEFEGNGVGLAIVQRIIHRHGGKVWAIGNEGKGATFYFSLPRK
jgi:PAS domain S-box-containing protein